MSSGGRGCMESSLVIRLVGLGVHVLVVDAVLPDLDRR
jgi:hypothetical protein